jgi:2-oxoacid:acceptor oxidoreductase delta subunit (pyruvate/2-ketoisovalerate family)
MTTYETLEDLPEAPVAKEPSRGIKTAGWRTFRPVIHLDACTKCNVCWKFCPDVAIDIDTEGWPVVRLEHCKGCGICAEECKLHAIEMVKEE